MGRIADITSGKLTSIPSGSAPAESTSTPTTMHDRLMALRSNTPTRPDALLNPEATHNKIAEDMTTTRRMIWAGGGVSKFPPVDPDIGNAKEVVQRMADFVTPSSLVPPEWLRGMNEFFSYGKNWLEAQEYNLPDLIAPNSMQKPEMQAMLAKKVLVGELTPLQAAREGLRIDSGKFDIEDIYNKFRGILHMKPDGITAAEAMVNGEKVTVPKLSTNPSAGDLYVDITEEDWWRRIVGDKAYAFMDNFAINFGELSPSPFISYGLQTAFKAANHRADLSLMDALRLTTFMTNDPLFIFPVDQVIRGGKVLLGLRLSPEMRAINKCKPLIINRSLLYDAEVIERYQAEKSAAIDEFVTSNPSATAEQLTAFKKSLPDIVAWQDSIRRNKLIKNYSLIMPDTPEVANRRAAYENAVYGGASDKDLKQLQRAYMEALDAARSTIVTGEPGRSFEQSVEIAVNQLRSSVTANEDIKGMVGDPKLAEQLNKIVNTPGISAKDMSEQILRIARTPEQIDEISNVIRHLENTADKVRRVKLRLRNAGLSDKQIEDRMQELTADAVIGLEYRAKYGARKSTTTGAEGLDDWLNPLIMNDDDLAHRDLLSDPQVEDLVRLIRHGEVPELSPIKLSAMSYFWGDPYFKTNFAPLAMAHREAQLGMVDYLNIWQGRLQNIMNRIGIRGRDRFGILGSSRAELRELYGKALGIEQTVPKSELYKYYIVDGKRITPEEVSLARDRITSVMRQRADELDIKLTTLDREITTLQRKRSRLLSEYERRKLVADLETSRTGKPQEIGMSHPDSDPDYIHLTRRMDEYERLKKARSDYETEIDAVNDGVALQDILKSPVKELDDQIIDLERTISKVKDDQVTQASRKGTGSRSGKVVQRDFDQEISIHQQKLQKLKAERAKFPAQRQIKIAYDEILADHADEFKNLTQEDWDNISEISKLVDKLYADLLVQRPELAKRLSEDPVTSRNLMSLVNLLTSRGRQEVTNFSSQIARDNVYFLGDPNKVAAGKTVTWDILEPLQYVINEANRQIHLSPIINELDTEVKAASAAGDFHRSNYLKIILARVRGEPTPLDKSVDAAWYSIIESTGLSGEDRSILLNSLKAPTQWATGIVHGMYRGLLTGNTGFAIKNLFQTANTVGLAGRIPTLKGAYKYFCTEDGKLLAEHAHLTYEFENFMAMSSVRSNAGKVLDNATLATEQVNRGIAFWVGVDEGLKILQRQGFIKKLDIAEAIEKGYGRYVLRQGTDVAFQTQHIYGSFGTPAGWIGKDIFGSDILRPGVQFVNYQLKQADFAKRMFQDKNFEGLMRWFQTSGHIVRMLSDAGINGTEFVGPYFGQPDVTGPAPTLGIELLATGGAMLSGDGTAQEMHWNNTKRLGIILAGGTLGIPMTPAMRAIEYVKGQAGPDSTDGIIRGAGGNLLQQLSDKDAVFRLMGLPSTTAQERVASTALLKEFEMRRFFESTRNAAILANVMQGPVAEDRPPDEVEQEVINNLMTEMGNNPISMVTAGQVAAAYRRHNIPQGVRQLLNWQNINLLRKAGKLDKIRSLLEVNKIWLSNAWGNEEYEKTYKNVAGIQYEEEALDSANKLIQKGSGNDTQR